LARASTPVKFVVEQCWTLLGEYRGRIWYCRRVRRTSGQRASVNFDGAWALQREETHGDVVGFVHTHPDGPASPSDRDVRTMRAWCSAFGKPLLCVIASPDTVRGYRFSNDESADKALETVETFPRGVVIGVDADGSKVPSRSDLPRR
jgi:proteasome lid subunit RPN8/RPN11